MDSFIWDTLYNTNPVRWISVSFALERTVSPLLFSSRPFVKHFKHHKFTCCLTSDFLSLSLSLSLISFYLILINQRSTPETPAFASWRVVSKLLYENWFDKIYHHSVQYIMQRKDIWIDTLFRRIDFKSISLIFRPLPSRVWFELSAL